jgi:hypothetical protein
MKNKPYPALLEGSYLFNEIKKRTSKSRETIPFNTHNFTRADVHMTNEVKLNGVQLCKIQ